MSNIQDTLNGYGLLSTDNQLPDPVSKQNTGMYIGGGLLGYRTPLFNGILNGGINANKLSIDWHDAMSKIMLEAQRNGNWNINYQRNF